MDHRRIRATTLALALTCLAACGRGPSSRGPEPADGRPISVDLRSAPGHHVLLLPGQATTLVIDVGPSAIRVIVASGGRRVGDPSLPVGFTPASARVVGDRFYLVGERCKDPETCQPAVLESAEEPVAWSEVGLDSKVGPSTSLVDAGDWHGRFFLAGGTLSVPVMALRDRDGGWTQVAWPRDVGTEPLAICSTSGEVYLFGAIGTALAPQTDTSPAERNPEFRAYHLAKGLRWETVDLHDGKAPSDPSSGEVRGATLCSDGALVLQTASKTRSIEVRPTDAEISVDLVATPPFSTPDDDQPFPRAGITAPTGEVITGDATARRFVPVGSTLLATSESPSAITVLVEYEDGSIHLHSWAER